MKRKMQYQNAEEVKTERTRVTFHALRFTFQDQEGFTLVEIMIAVAIFMMLLGFGLIISMDFYRSYSFNSERNIALAVLRKARTEAMVNLDQAPHGVHITATQYTIFEGASY